MKTFSYFGLTYEILNDNEVALYEGPDKDKIIIPRQVEYDDKAYVVTQIGSENRCMYTEAYKSEGIRDDRYKDGWKIKPSYYTIPESREAVGPFNFIFKIF